MPAAASAPTAPTAVVDRAGLAAVPHRPVGIDITEEAAAIRGTSGSTPEPDGGSSRTSDVDGVR